VLARGLSGSIIPPFAILVVVSEMGGDASEVRLHTAKRRSPVPSRVRLIRDLWPRLRGISVAFRSTP